MTTETDKLKSALNRNGLTERLRRAATVSDAGPGGQHTFHTVGSDGYLQRAGDPGAEPEKSDRDIILELNEAIQEIIADAPLQLPEPQSARPAVAGMAVHPTPIPQPIAQQPGPPRTQGLPPQGIPVGQQFQERVALPPPDPSRRADDDGHLQDWLSRMPEEQPEPRSRSRSVLLGIGALLLSILAGYGSAQLLKNSRSVDEQTAEWTSSASNGAMQSSSQRPRGAGLDEGETDSQEDGFARLLKRVTTQPVRRTVTITPAETESSASVEPQGSAADPEPDPASEQESPPTYRVASITGFAGAVPEPVPAQNSVVLRPASTSPDEPDTPEPATSAPPAPTQTTIPGDEMEGLFRRAEQLIAERDIAAARLVLRHLAESGSGPAAMKLAEAYDPDWLAENGASGVPANKDLALRWYAMAHDRGEPGANARMEALSQSRQAGVE